MTSFCPVLHVAEMVGGRAFLNSRRVWDVDLVDMVTLGTGSGALLCIWVGTTAATSPLEEGRGRPGGMGPTTCMGRGPVLALLLSLVLSLGRICLLVEGACEDRFEEAMEGGREGVMEGVIEGGMEGIMEGVMEGVKEDVREGVRDGVWEEAMIGAALPCGLLLNDI